MTETEKHCDMCGGTKDLQVWEEIPDYGGPNSPLVIYRCLSCSREFVKKNWGRR
jgi:hypothetical protein